MASTLQYVWQHYNETGCEATVHRTLQTKLGAESDAPDVRAFLADLETLLAEPETLLLVLSIGLGGRFESQASFLGLLLREDVLQPAIVDLLLEKLSEFSVEMDAQMMEKNVPKLILRELRWLDVVVDSQQLIAKLLGALPAFTPSLQRDVIYILPEIASDEDAAVVVDALLELIRMDASLVACCIEALGHFAIAADQSAVVVQCVLERLDSSPLADLPAIVKYLVQEAPVAHASDSDSDTDAIVSALRDKLSSSLAFSGNSVTSENDVDRNNSSRNDEALILSSITQGFVVRDELLQSFLKAIQSTTASSTQASLTQSTQPTTTQSTTLRLLDVWVLIGAHALPKYADKIAKIVRKVVHSGTITRALLVTSVCGHADALRSLFLSLLQLSALLLTTPNDATCVGIGSLLYELLFEEFATDRSSYGGNGTNETAFYQGEVVSMLLSHALSRNAATKDAALATLQALVAPLPSFHADSFTVASTAARATNRRDRLRVFLPALKQLLDAMESCSAAHVRVIYDVLFAIGGADDADLNVTLRKQAFHQDVRFRCFGILAAVARIKRLLVAFSEQLEARKQQSETTGKSKHDTRQQQQRSESDSSVTAAALDPQAVTMLTRALEELHASCLTHAACLAFVVRELELLIGSLDAATNAVNRAFVDIVSDFYTEVLLQRFMADFDVAKMRDGAYTKVVLDGAMKTELWVGLDDKASPVYLKILDLVASPNVAVQQSLLFLSPLTSLVVACARAKQQLTDVECLLVCPIQLMERSVLQDLSGLDAADQNAVCLTLWHGVNWLRTILNLFANEPRAYYAAKVAERLENLVLLESLLLNDALPASPSFQPPGVRSSNATSAGAVAASADATKSVGDSTKKPVGRPAGKKRVGNLDDRKLAVRQSFLPLEPDILRILTSPRLQPVVTGGSSRTITTNRPLPSDATGSSTADVDVPLVAMLFALLQRHLLESVKRKAATAAGSGFWTAKAAATAAAAAMSDDILQHPPVLQTTDELLALWFASGVLDAVGTFAAHLLRVTERELLARSIDADPDADDNNEALPDTFDGVVDADGDVKRDAQLLERKRVLIGYLKIVTAVVHYAVASYASTNTTDDADDDSTPTTTMMQQLQALLVPPADRVAYVEGDTRALQQIIKQIFKVVIRYHRVVESHLDVAVALLQCLVAILSLASGYNATNVLHRTLTIDLSMSQQLTETTSSSQLPKRRRTNLSTAIATKLSTLAHTYLQTDWSPGDATLQQSKAACLDVVLTTYLHHSAVVLDSIQTLAIDGVLVLLEQQGSARVPAYPTLDKQSLGTFHRAMLRALVAATARLDVGGSGASRGVANASDVPFVLNYVTQAVLLFKLLVCLTKSFPQRVVVASVLKLGRRFLETILRAMPFFQVHFVCHSAHIIKLISELQVATRRMQVLCAHGKLLKDASAATHVPIVKKLLEQLIYRSEELARANGVLDAYTTGVLKNRRIDGTTISKKELEARDDESEEEAYATEEDAEVDEQASEEEREEEERVATPVRKRRTK